MDKTWVGIDAGKEFHWAHVLDASRTTSFSPAGSKTMRRDLLRLIEEVLSLAEEVVLGHRPARRRRGAAAGAACGSETRGSSTSPASPSIGPATPTAESPRPTPKTLTSSPTKPV